MCDAELSVTVRSAKSSSSVACFASRDLSSSLVMTMLELSLCENRLRTRS